jgi:Dyp-type peroxidase family
VKSGAANGSTRAWKLRAPYARDTQGLVASHFSHLKAAAALFLELPPSVGGGWLTALRRDIVISNADGSREDQSAAALAFTHSGLQQMNLASEVLDTFSIPFCEGMHQTDRQRRLGDSSAAAVRTVVAGGAEWSGNTATQSAEGSLTPVVVHALLVIYALDDEPLDEAVQRAISLIGAHGVKVVRQRRLSLREDRNGIAREHFGFADGISQPLLQNGEAVISPAGESAEEMRSHGVPAGEILLGHVNRHNEPAPGPVIALDRNPAASHLSPIGAAEGFRNLGFNGSYLVVRELRQNVAAFWNSLDEAARQLTTSGVDAQWLAEKVVGRRIDGAPLVAAASSSDGVPLNNFGYAASDIHGFECPLGAHIRRANPRDSFPSRDKLQPDLAAGRDLLEAANSHRILRRGRKYGPDIADARKDDGQDRGLLFMCLNSDLVRQFEFVQEHWLLNCSFATLFDETDPLLGPRGRMTIPAHPLRLRPTVETYVQLVGGEYFFLPSLSALDYFESL